MTRGRTWCIVVAAAAGWTATAACAHDATIPACDALGTVSAVTRLATQDGMAMAVALLAPRQVGVAAALGQRGCVGTLVADGTRIAHAWIVSSGARPGYRAADRAIVEARFGHIDASGRFANTGAPLGREALALALRDGVAQLRAPYTAALAADRQERAREIADIEPLGACRAAAAGSYVCSVLIEHNDPLAVELRLDGARTLRADFTFERVSGTTAWRVGPQFAGEFGRAVTKNRSAAVRDAVSGFVDSFRAPAPATSTGGR